MGGQGGGKWRGEQQGGGQELPDGSGEEGMEAGRAAGEGVARMAGGGGSSERDVGLVGAFQDTHRAAAAASGDNGRAWKVDWLRNFTYRAKRRVFVRLVFDLSMGMRNPCVDAHISIY